MKNVRFERPDGKKLNIEIIKYRTNESNRSTSEGRHRHDFHSIFFIQDGSSLQEIDFENYDIHTHQVMIIPKGSVHWEKTVKGLAGYVILFNEDFFSNVQTQLLNGFLFYAIALRKLLIDVPNEQVETLEHYFNLLHQEQDDDGNQNQKFLLQNLMLALLNKLEGLIQNLPEVNSFINKRKPFQRFIELVEQNYAHHKSLDFYTQELNLTSRKLNEIIKELTGYTATHFIIDRIMVEAKRELCFGEKSIKEISASLGYESQYYFSRIFKKRTEVSPEQFRAQFAE